MSIKFTHHTPKLKSLFVPKQRKNKHKTKKNTKIDMSMSMMMVQVKRKLGKVIRKHVSEKWDLKTFIISKRRDIQMVC